jgi:hypothetical protein
VIARDETISAEQLDQFGVVRLLERLLRGAPIDVRAEWARFLDLDAAVIARLSAKGETPGDVRDSTR